jgi:hypothetical protein
MVMPEPPLSSPFRTSLERIHPHHCQAATNAGVRELFALPVLRQLSIEGCRNVTREGTAGFPSRVRVSYSSI